MAPIFGLAEAKHDWRSILCLSPPRATDWRVQKVIAYFSGNLDKRIRLSRLAGSLEITPRHLSRLFLIHTGQSPSAKLMSIRLKEGARLLLEKPALAVAEIAWRVGMQPVRFSREFRERFKRSPSEFRRVGGRGDQDSNVRCSQEMSDSVASISWREAAES